MPSNGDGYDVLKSQREWREAKKEAQEDPAGSLAATLIFVKKVGKKVDKMDRQHKEDKKVDDQRHEVLMGTISNHCSLPAQLAHPGTTEEGAGDDVEDGITAHISGDTIRRYIPYIILALITGTGTGIYVWG